MSLRRVPVAVSGRDGDGVPFELEVAGELRHPVLILDPRGRVAGSVDVDGFCGFDVPNVPYGSPAASPDGVRQSLAKHGRFSATVDERGVVMSIRAEPRR